MNAKSSKRKTRRKRLNSYRVWFRDGTSVVVQAEYPNQVFDIMPVEIRMKIDRVVDDI